MTRLLLIQLLSKVVMTVLTAQTCRCLAVTLIQALLKCGHVGHAAGWFQILLHVISHQDTKSGHGGAAVATAIRAVCSGGFSIQSITADVHSIWAAKLPVTSFKVSSSRCCMVRMLSKVCLVFNL